MTLPRKLHLLFVVCLFLCSVATMHGQASSFEEEIYTNNFGGETGCSKASTTKLTISCSSSWQKGGAQGYEKVIAKNGYGTMGFYGYSSIKIFVDHFNGADAAVGSEEVVDYLSLYGLRGQPTAFLKLIFECLECAKIGNAAIAEYGANTSGYYSCLIPTPPQNSPLCTLNVPIVYDQTGQPDPITMERVLAIDANTTVINGPAGAKVTTTVCIGYLAGGCPFGATVKASVVNAKGKVIRGVKVVGSSGHIYN